MEGQAGYYFPTLPSHFFQAEKFWFLLVHYLRRIPTAIMEFHLLDQRVVCWL